MYLDAGAISFPGLGIDGINPPQTLPFTIFGREIYLYGIVIAFGFLLGILYLRKRAKDFGTTFDLITDAILFAVPISIICARIYYVAFQWEHYKDNPISVLYIWEGGIAIYGGVIGAILGLLLFARVRKQKLTPYLDLMSLGLLIGQSIGRWGNFFNREAHGVETASNYFLRMYMYSSKEHMYGNWHPTFLYESVWNLIGFLLLHKLSKKRKYDGQTFLQYLAWYGLGRVWIEGLRTDSLYLFGSNVRVSQLLAGVSFVAAVGVMLYIRLFKEPDGSGMLVNQAAGNGQQATGDEENEEDEGADPSTPLRSAQDDVIETVDAVGAAIGRPPEAESSDEASGIRDQASGDEEPACRGGSYPEGEPPAPPEAETPDESPVTSHQSPEDEENGSFDSGSASAQDDIDETVDADLSAAEDSIDETEDAKPSE